VHNVNGTLAGIDNRQIQVPLFFFFCLLVRPWAVFDFPGKIKDNQNNQTLGRGLARRRISHNCCFNFALQASDVLEDIEVV
jgi:hypothetical protein